MKLTYDPTQNIAYLRLHEKKIQVDTIRVSDEMNVDIAPDGPCTVLNCSMPTRKWMRKTTATWS